ncbi:MAG: helix-turn-helix transcriptional regulator [Acidobacteriota bacterium]|nr:helix-turn-helix transcriptional regulator [Acidobacteriota bacterium]
MRSEAHRAFGLAVRTLREERGLSQEALALECHLDRTYIGGIERGERNPSLTNILKIAAALGVRASALLARGEGIA